MNDDEPTNDLDELIERIERLQERHQRVRHFDDAADATPFVFRRNHFFNTPIPRPRGVLHNQQAFDSTIIDRLRNATVDLPAWEFQHFGTGFDGDTADESRESVSPEEDHRRYLQSLGIL